ncbi:hypothetical protein D3C85_1220520 [compost metagenome]
MQHQHGGGFMLLGAWIGHDDAIEAEHLALNPGAGIVGVIAFLFTAWHHHGARTRVGNGPLQYVIPQCAGRDLATACISRTDNLNQRVDGDVVAQHRDQG